MSEHEEANIASFSFQHTIDQERIDSLLAALIVAKHTIKALHGPVAWDIYEAHSPEMKKINSALIGSNAS